MDQKGIVVNTIDYEDAINFAEIKELKQYWKVWGCDL
jgi:hypothetical protein